GVDLEIAEDAFILRSTRKGRRCDIEPGGRPRIVHQVLVVEVGAPALSGDEFLEIGVHDTREFACPLLCDGAWRARQFTLACPNVVPARYEPGPQEQGKRRRQQRGGIKSARDARNHHRSRLHAYPAPLTDTMIVGSDGSISSFLRST